MAAAMLEFMSELRLRLLASAHGSDSLRSLSKQVIDDCSRFMLDVERIANRSKLPLPDSLDEEHKKLLERMGEITGADFDSAYIELTALRQRHAIKLFKRGQTIKIPEISALASRALAMIEAHVKLSRQVSGSIDSPLDDERFPHPGSAAPQRSGAES